MSAFGVQTYRFIVSNCPKMSICRTIRFNFTILFTIVQYRRGGGKPEGNVR